MDNEDIKFYGNSPENKRSLTSLIKERLQDVKDAISDSFENMDLSNVALAGVFTIGIGLAGGLEDILNDFENIMKHMLDYSNVPKPL